MIFTPCIRDKDHCKQGLSLTTVMHSQLLSIEISAAKKAQTNNFMNATHIEHIGIAVRNLQEAIQYYEKILGLSCYAIEEVQDQKVKTAFFKIGQTKIELLESTHPEGPIAKFIDKKGPGLHHMAIAVEGIGESLNALQQKGVSLIDQKPRKGAEGLKIAFLHPKSTFGVLTELCEPETISTGEKYENARKN
jgi:methylmalonyl-CoA/ethylmalonyl-CoA epimerase